MELVIPDVFHVQEPMQIIMHAGPSITLLPGCSIYRSSQSLLVVNEQSMAVHEISMMNVMGMAREATIEEAQGLIVGSYHNQRKHTNMH